MGHTDTKNFSSSIYGSGLKRTFVFYLILTLNSIVSANKWSWGPIFSLGGEGQGGPWMDGWLDRRTNEQIDFPRRESLS